jgi:hypothetical protein
MRSRYFSDSMTEINTIPKSKPDAISFLKALWERNQNQGDETELVLPASFAVRVSPQGVLFKYYNGDSVIPFEVAQGNRTSVVHGALLFCGVVTVAYPNEVQIMTHTPGVPTLKPLLINMKEDGVPTTVQLAFAATDIDGDLGRREMLYKTALHQILGSDINILRRDLAPGEKIRLALPDYDEEESS